VGLREIGSAGSRDFQVYWRCASMLRRALVRVRRRRREFFAVDVVTTPQEQQEHEPGFLWTT